MRRTAAVASVAALAVVLVGLPTTSESQTAPGAASPKPKPLSATEARKRQTGCGTLYRPSHFHAAARKVYRSSSPPTGAEKRKIRKFVRCQRTARSTRNVRRVHMPRYRRGNAYRVELARLLPYRCGANGRWAIPCSIVYCESKYSWGAINGSGARGPYQLLGKPDPWPVRTRAHRLAHHRIAAGLWRGGAGSSHWQQCL